MSGDDKGGEQSPPIADTLETIGVIETKSLDQQTKLMAAQAYCDAQGMPCEPEAWQRFVRTLWIAAWEARQRTHHQLLPEHLGTIARYNQALYELIEANPWLKELGLHQPLITLQVAITDIARGERPALFMPVTPKKRDRPLPPGEWDIVKGQAARALTLLMQAGENKKAAAGKIARALNGAYVLSAESITATTIENWRTRHNQGHGADGVTEISLAHFNGPLPATAGATPRAQAEWIIRNLRKAPALKARKVRQVPT